MANQIVPASLRIFSVISEQKGQFETILVRICGHPHRFLVLNPSSFGLQDDKGVVSGLRMTGEKKYLDDKKITKKINMAKLSQIFPLYVY